MWKKMKKAYLVLVLFLRNTSVTTVTVLGILNNPYYKKLYEKHKIHKYIIIWLLLGA